jgi:accessory gene regulator protein AgrB
VHTHFGSATHLIGATLEVLLAFTFLRFAAYHGVHSRHALVSGLSKALLVQTG